MAQKAVDTDIMQWVRPQVGIPRRLWRTWSRKPLGLAGAFLVLTLLGMSIFAKFITPYDDLHIIMDHRLMGPSAAHWLGADAFGRDMYARLVYGSRISLFMGFMVITLGGITGGIWGILSGYLGGKFDLLTQRFVDIMQAFPSLILAMAIVAALGFGLVNTAIAIALPRIDAFARVVRSQALSVAQREYIVAAQSMGASGTRIVFRHMLPNCIAPWLIIATAGLGGAIIAEASLSFLGLGVPPPHPSWGGMLSGGVTQYAERAPHLIIFPGIFLSLAVFGFNLFGDAVRDVMDPRLRR